MSNYGAELERKYQNKIVNRFTDKKRLNYIEYSDVKHNKQELTEASKETNWPIRSNDVIAFLRKQKYTEKQVNEALRQLKEKVYLSSPKRLLQTNQDVYSFLTGGTKIRPREDSTIQDVMFFDFKNYENNNFYIAQEVSYTDPLTGLNSRPDIVVYVNGIALAVIELKRSLISLEEGIRQHLSNQVDLIPSFFTTVQFCIASSDKNTDENGFRYGTILTPMKFWCPYKIDTTETGVIVSDIQAFDEFFNKERFMTFFQYGVINHYGIKKIMRPHQFHALRACMPRMLEKASGIIWHSQGSGKSLTMIWLANYIRANFDDPRVIIITDRTELDIQIQLNFTNAENEMYRTDSTSDLLDTLHDGKQWLLCSLVQKFAIHKKGEEEKSSVQISLDKYLKQLEDYIKIAYPNGFTVRGKNIFIFVDECHRTQGGRLHEGMRKIMGQEVMLIGFTGTPLLKDDKAKHVYNSYKNLSEVKFGPFIHKYLHKQAVEDKVILDLQYESRDVEQTLTSKEKLDEQLNTIIKDLSDDRAEQVKSRWATLEKVYSSKDRIEKICYSIIDDVKNDNRLNQDWCNAMLVAGDIYSAYKYYEYFQYKLDDTCLRDLCAVVTSFEPAENTIRKDITDPNKISRNKFKYDMAKKSFEVAGFTNREDYEEWAKDTFKKQPAKLKLLIVVDKLLTGFDAPSATFLYIDKDMHDQDLFQALCRVNRLGEDIKDDEGTVISVSHKEYGIIVDFKHLFDNIEAAIEKFNNENKGMTKIDPEDIEGLLQDHITKNKKHLEFAKEAYEALKVIWDSKQLCGGTKEENLEKLVEYYKDNSKNENIEEERKQLYSITQALVTTYSNMADLMGKANYTREQSNYIENLAREACQINLRVKQASGDYFDVRIYDPDMRQLLDRFIRADEAETIIPATADFSFLDLIDSDSDEEELLKKTQAQANNNSEAVAEIIESKARATINDFKDKDPELFKKFSYRLQELLDRIKLQTADFTQKARLLIALIKETKSGEGNYPEGINSKRKRALWNNRDKWIKNKSDEEIAKIVLTIDDFITKKAGASWMDRSSVDYDDLQEDLMNLIPELNEELYFELYMLAVRNS